MLAFTHLFFALLLIRAFNLDKQAAFATLLFGVFIDLDHLFGMVDFVVREGWQNAFNVNAALSSDIQWKSLLHSPEGVLFVGPVALLSRMLLPLVAWGVHIVLDYVQIYYLGIASPLEMLLMASLMVGLLFYERRDYEVATGGASVPGLLRWEATRLKATVSDLPIIRFFRRSRGPRGTSS